MPLSAPEYWLEWTKNYFRCQFTHMGGLFHKKNAPESTPLWIVAFWKFNRALWGLTTAVSVFVNSTNITTNIETAVLSRQCQNRCGNFYKGDLLVIITHLEIVACPSTFVIHSIFAAFHSNSPTPPTCPANSMHSIDLSTMYATSNLNVQ